MKNFLCRCCFVYVDYFGILDSQAFSIKFPYLQLFFHFLNKWRFETGRVTLNEDIVLNATEFVIHNGVVQNAFMHSMQTR